MTARELGIDARPARLVNDEAARERIAAAAPEAICVCAFGALIKEPLLSEHRMLNVHPSLLPRWRGAAPIERAIMAGDELTGVSIMALTAGLDSGPVCAAAQPSRSRPDDTYGTLAARLQALGGELLVDALDERPAVRRAGRRRWPPTPTRSPPRTACCDPHRRPPSSSGWCGR